MNVKLNKKVCDYLSSLKLPKSTRLIITDLDKSVYDTSNNINESINKDLLKFILSNLNSNPKQLTKNKVINIFQKEELNVTPISQIIISLRTNTLFNIKGCVILLNYSNTLDKGSIEFVKTITHNIEFYTKINDMEEIQKYENSPIYDTKKIKSILDIIDENIDKLYIDKNYKHLEELLYFKIDCLRNSVDYDSIKLFDEILELLEEKKEYYAIYALVFGSGLKKQLNQIQHL